MELKLKSKNLQGDLEAIADVLSVCLNGGLSNILKFDLQKKEHHKRSFLWMYQNNGSASNFEEATRIDLMPTVNNYWLYFRSRTDSEIVFELNYRYSNHEEIALYNNLLLYSFKDVLTIKD